MFNSSKRLVGRNGARAVVLSTTATPFVAAYRFDPVSGWGTKYADPATVTAFGTEARGVAFAPNNSKIVLCGVTGTVFAVYDWTYASGFGARATTAYTNPDDNSFSRDGNKLLISGPSALAEYNYSPSGVGSLFFNISPGSNEFRKSAYIFDDKYVIGGFISALSFRIYSRSATPTILASAPSFFGAAAGFSMSPITHSGTRMLAVPISGGIVSLFRIAANGTIDSTVTSTMGSTYHAAIFDPYGRLIVGGASNLLRIYTLDSAGNQTLLATASDFAGGTARALSYDEDRDILFVGSSGSPFITAYRMGGAGFVSKYANPGTLLTTGVRDISLAYDDAWKYTAI